MIPITISLFVQNASELLMENLERISQNVVLDQSARSVAKELMRLRSELVAHRRSFENINLTKTECSLLNRSFMGLTSDVRPPITLVIDDLYQRPELSTEAGQHDNVIAFLLTIYIKSRVKPEAKQKWIARKILEGDWKMMGDKGEMDWPWRDGKVNFSSIVWQKGGVNLFSREYISDQIRQADIVVDIR